MKITIEINTDNAAFTDANGDARDEVARILQDWIDKDLMRYGFTDDVTFDGVTPRDLVQRNLRDINGNKCGKVTITE